MKKTILVLDDNKDMRESICAIFAERGYKVVPAASVPEAVTGVRTHSIDLAIIDIKMPIVDGYKFCEFMRSVDKFSHIPIVIVTGEEKRYGRETAELLKLESFIEKPYDPLALVRKVEEILKKKGKMP